MSAPYESDNVQLIAGGSNDPALVRALQRDLRALGYLGAAIDGDFGPGTTGAIRALEFDLLHNDGHGTDGDAPVAVMAFNARPGGGNYVETVTGTFTSGLAAALANMASDPRIGTLPASSDPAGDNERAVTTICNSGSAIAPPPFVLAISMQESDSRHFRVPRAGDDDSYVIAGLDRNEKGNPDRVTSRGYGIGQYTFFHHPLSPEEVNEYVAEPLRNVQHAFRELRDKFDHFVVGTRGADDRSVEHPRLPLRLCRYAPSDSRYFNDCRTCAHQVRRIDIERGTPAYSGASVSYQPTQYYASASYPGTPDRAAFLCDWPYAVRRYNGSGVNSFHYQARILFNLLR
jgi:peptidoglycan hydrolase-like protein with peptidoglycan-binding domain